MSEDIKLEPWKPERRAKFFAIDTKHDDIVIPAVSLEYEGLFERIDTGMFNAFETGEAAKRCALRELAMRKLYRFAEQLNPPRWNLDKHCIEYWTVGNFSNEFIAVCREYTGYLQPLDVPFHSREACEQAWSSLTEEERESLFWK